MKTIHHRFVKYIPEELEEGIVYVSVDYRTVAHKCICGCGNRVVTPITPDSWTFSFNGKTISLSPSIGNWNFECKSHYFIRNNEIVMARKWMEPDPPKKVFSFFAKKRKSKKNGNDGK